MARTINKVELLGRVGTDPEMQYTPNGTAVTKLRLATDRRRQDGRSRPTGTTSSSGARPPKPSTSTSARATASTSPDAW